MSLKKFDYLKLRDFDKEMSLLDEDLYEFTRSFPPSYPFMEDLVNHLKYMETRCPAWCDRVVFNKQLHNLLINEPNCQYDMIGLQAPMGDHKVSRIKKNIIKILVNIDLDQY